MNYNFRPSAWDPSRQSVADIYCAGFMIAELLALEPKTQIAGVTLIADVGGFGYSQFRHMTLENIKNVVAFFQDSYPLWFRVTHVVNAPRLFDLIFSFFKPFLTDYTRESIQFHNTLDTLHDQVGREILPKV